MNRLRVVWTRQQTDSPEMLVLPEALRFGIDSPGGTGTLAPAMVVPEARAAEHHKPYLIGPDGWYHRVTVLGEMAEQVLAEVTRFAPRSARGSRRHVLIPESDVSASGVLRRFFTSDEGGAA